MYYEEYGDKANPTIVMLHGANFVHAFGRQYVLADRYHIIVPHITGFGKETDTVFTVQKAAEDITQIIREQNKKVTLMGFSLGAQLASYLVAKIPELLNGAIIVSPWLIKEEPMLSFVMEQNEKQFHSMKKRWFCWFVGLMNGLPKQPRKEFVEYMQRVQLQTIRNCVDNGIELNALPEFAAADLSILAIAGEKEQDEVKESIIQMSKLNLNCSYEIWEKAEHNIPPVFAKQFNARVIEFMNHIQ